MAEQKRTVRSNKPTTPDEFATQSPTPSGDYSYTLEIVMNMQHSMGRLLEAVESLKSTSKEQTEKLNSLSEEIHGYKIGFQWIKGLLWAMAALLAFLTSSYIAYHRK